MIYEGEFSNVFQATNLKTKEMIILKCCGSFCSWIILKEKEILQELDQKKITGFPKVLFYKETK
jgi:hypothetical protein